MTTFNRPMGTGENMRSKRIYEGLFVAAVAAGLLTLAACAGCAGAVANTSVSALVSTTAQSVAVLKPQADAGTLGAQDCLDVNISVGEFADTIATNAQGTWLGNYLFGAGHGWLNFDQAYQPALYELLAEMKAARDLSISGGRWAATPPSSAYLNSIASANLRAVLTIGGMLADKTTQTVMLHKRTAKKIKLAAKDTQTLLDIIAAKLPAGWIDLYNSLPSAVKDQISADLPIVAQMATDQVIQWWANVQAGDTVTARELVIAQMTDSQIQAACLTGGNAAVAAVNAHVAGQNTLVDAGWKILQALILAAGAAIGI